MKADIGECVKNCLICMKNNSKKMGGSMFITTSQPLERMAVDIMKLDECNKYVLVCIDYFTSFCSAVVLNNRREKNVVDELAKMFSRIGCPRGLVTDNAKEFWRRKFTEFCFWKEIAHKKVSVESHRSNGRVERVIGTLRCGLRSIKMEIWRRDWNKYVKCIIIHIILQ